jgi:hypothetical protein
MDLGHAHDMIDMRVREPDRGQSPTPAFEFTEKARGFLAGIDDHGIAGSRIPHEVTVFDELPVGENDDLQIRHSRVPYVR